MSEEQRQEGLAQIHDIRRRLASMDFSDVSDISDDPDGPEAEVIEIVERKKNRRYDPEHPAVALPRRLDVDG